MPSSLKYRFKKDQFCWTVLVNGEAIGTVYSKTSLNGSRRWGFVGTDRNVSCRPFFSTRAIAAQNLIEDMGLQGNVKSGDANEKKISHDSC